jgi:ATP-dependent Clp protease ATP-binding subunit ClpC
MEGTRQRCDCELGLDEAATGDLPHVCAWCGEAAELFYQGPLNWGAQRVHLRLPLCRSHQNHWRRQFWALYSLLGGACLMIVGVNLMARGGKLPQLSPEFLLTMAGALATGFGIITVCVSLGTHWVLVRCGIRIRHLGATYVTLMHVAPEFAEACRDHRRSKLVKGRSTAPPRPREEHREEPGPDVPLAEEARQALAVAAEEARGLGHDYLGTKHLLVGLRVSPTPAAKALQALGIDAEQIRQACRAATPQSPELLPGREVPATPAVRRALARAATEAHALNHATVRAGHLLLGVLREPENEAVQILLDLGITPEEAGRRTAAATHLLEGMMAKEDLDTREGLLPKGDRLPDADGRTVG